MKNLTKSIKSFWLLLTIGVFMTSCVVYTDQGPKGPDGKVYFGIDYDYNPPYSYWDNNSSVPLNPYFGEVYRTEEGTYDFEYFINPWEYWWGTYTLYENEGEWGGANNTPGLPGDDTFFLLICNDDGFYHETWDECGCRAMENPDGSVTVEGVNKQKFRVEMKKSTVMERPAKENPKFKKE